MSLTATQTAILVFLRSEEEEIRAKRFLSAAGRARNRRIAGLLNRHAVRLARATGHAVHVIKGKRQVGRTFGERFTNAFAALFARGYDEVIAMGNDCLALTPRHLRDAQAFLADHSMVLGPAHDGGAYLIGLRRRAFDAALFQGLPWQQPELLDALLAYGRRQGGPVPLLAREWDADEEVSFGRALAILGIRNPLVRQLSVVLARRPAPAGFLWTLHCFCQYSYLLRGPPRPVLVSCLL